jgi:hypothetical protein
MVLDQKPFAVRCYICGLNIGFDYRHQAQLYDVEHTKNCPGIRGSSDLRIYPQITGSS